MWRVPKDFDGESFRDRYGLSKFDFTVRDGNLTLEPGVTLPDNPPIMDAVDPVKREKKKRKDAIAAIDADVVKLFRAMYALVAKNGKPFDDWRDDVLGVADLQSPTKK